MSGNPVAFNTMPDCTNHGGKIALLGIIPQNTGIDWDKVVLNGITIKGIYGREMYETCYKITSIIIDGVRLCKAKRYRYQ